ncbi:MAG: YcaO-like family protein [Gemmatimonadaceae bacterium]|nr:YcaO-like family protein [Gemmatimonadaceae bacterium]
MRDRISPRSRIWHLPSPSDAPLAVALASPAGRTTAQGAHRLTPCLGAGSTPLAAARRAHDEYCERWSGFHQPEDPELLAPFDAVADRAIAPNALRCLSRRQLADARRGVPAAEWGLDRTLPLAWTVATALDAGPSALVPSHLVYFGYRPPRGVRVPRAAGRADSNGCAAGRSTADATRRALLELVERDAVAQWWYHQAPRPEVPRAVWADDRRSRLVEWLARDGRDTWMLDLTGDLGIPVVAAVSVRRQGTFPRVLLGFAARLDRRTAAHRALDELLQEAMLVHAADRGLLTQPAADRRWLREGTLDAQPQLVPNPRQRRSRVRVRPSFDDAGAPRDAADVAQLIERLTAARLRAWMVDLTRADSSRRVVRVVVPGLRPWWPHFAPGRLFTAPVRAGWLRRARHELRLNAFGIWF